MLSHFNRLSPSELERLAILDEEMHEVGQIIGKILRHGYESYNPTTSVPEDQNPIINRWLLEKELGHVLWSMQMMCAANDMNSDSIERGAKEKSERATNYFHHQPVKHESSSCCGGVGCNSCKPQWRGGWL